MTKPPAPDEVTEISTAMTIRRLTSLVAEKDYAGKRREAVTVRRVIAMLKSTPGGGGLETAPPASGRRSGLASTE